MKPISTLVYEKAHTDTLKIQATVEATVRWYFKQYGSIGRYEVTQAINNQAGKDVVTQKQVNNALNLMKHLGMVRQVYNAFYPPTTTRRKSKPNCPECSSGKTQVSDNYIVADQYDDGNVPGTIYECKACGHTWKE